MRYSCPKCQREYISYPCKQKKGWKLFCSTLCRSLARKTKVERTCQLCDKKFIVKRMAIKNSGAKYCSHKCMNKAQRGKAKHKIRGENHPNWRGGSSFYPYGSRPYTSEFNDTLKEAIRKRDNYECQMCGLREEEHILVWGASLQVHHIDYDKLNCKHDNLMSLCNQCHGRTNYNRKAWTENLKEVVKKGEKYEMF